MNRDERQLTWTCCGYATASRNASRRAAACPPNPALTERGRDQAERLAAWLALETDRRRAVEPAAPRDRDGRNRSPVRTGSRCRSSCRVSTEYDAQSDSYIPMEELQRARTIRTSRRCTRAVGRSSAPNRPDASAPGSRRRSTRSSPPTAAGGSSRCATAASSTSRSRSCSVSTAISGSSRTTRRCRGWSRRAPACAPRVTQRTRAPRRREGRPA